MQFRILIASAILISQVVAAQDGPAPETALQGTTTTVVSATPPGTVMGTNSAPGSSTSSQTAIMDYKSVYDTPTVEEEVKMAAERFNLTPSQQDVWLTAATERREGERQAHAMIDSKAANYEKDGAYKGLRIAQNEFYETVTGYLNPAQKQALETDRLIMQEKQKRLAKIPPPPPPVPTVTVTPVDSTAIKQEEKNKNKGKGSSKKSKRKKQAIIQ